MSTGLTTLTSAVYAGAGVRESSLDGGVELLAVTRHDSHV